ncbi:MAG: carboxypeptidase-like regulatory domain-containing protein, partial [Acidobacteriota bacterium]|nr:carboxypeptidase-like regulatory domain-containing protein [Acidobacteriota bacterium]
VRGTTSGAELSVTFYGPNNLLREHSRVAPSSEGRFATDGLEPGRYRVQINAGGDAVPVTRPGFQMIEIVPGGEPVRVDFDLLRLL